MNQTITDTVNSAFHEFTDGMRNPAEDISIRKRTMVPGGKGQDKGCLAESGFESVKNAPHCMLGRERKKQQD